MVEGATRPWGLASAEVLARVEDYLQEAATRTHDRLGDVAGVGVTTALHGGGPLTAGASTPLASEVDQIQYALGRGPCLLALHTGRSTYAPDLARDPRWGPYGPAAAEHGARSCLSVPIVDGRVVTGVVKVYSDRVDGLSEHQRRAGHHFALEAAGGIAIADALVTTSLELADRVTAMDTRHTIDLATGVLMGRLGCSADEAFDLLRRQSQHQGRKLQGVAAGLVGGHDPGEQGRDDTVAAGAGQRSGPAPDATPVPAPFLRRGEPPTHGR